MLNQGDSFFKTCLGLNMNKPAKKWPTKGQQLGSQLSVKLLAISQLSIKMSEKIYDLLIRKFLRI